MIGNSASSALVSRLGSIDWCCLPGLDCPPIFAALLDEAKGGRFTVQPRGEFRSEQRYPHRGRVLETVFDTPTGRGLLVDWMPMETQGVDDPPRLCRKVITLNGAVDWVLHCSPQFGDFPAEVECIRDRVFFRGRSHLEGGCLISDVPLQLERGRGQISARLRLGARESAHFTWAWGRVIELPASPEPALTLLRWRTHAHRCPARGPCPLGGPWHDLIAGSGLTLKLLQTGFSGAIASSVAPAHAGDPRTTCLRDAPELIRALSALGMPQERESYFDFTCNLLERDGTSNLQATYGLDGSTHVGSRAPVFQLGVYGQLALAIAAYRALTGLLPERAAKGLSEIADFACQAWRRPDQDPLERAGRPEHYVSSKLLCWAALDSAIGTLSAESSARWKREREILAHTIITQGFDRRLGSFTRSFSSRDLGPGALLAPILKFLPPDDPRITGTLHAISRHLVLTPGSRLKGGLLLVSGLARTGRVDEATEIFSELCSSASSLGLYGEELEGTEPAGAFPSASVHAQVVCAALDIHEARESIPRLRQLA